MVLLFGMRIAQDTGSNEENAKLLLNEIASLKSKVKLLKTAYKLEADKINPLQNRLEELNKGQKELNETLTQKESLCAKLKEEITSLKGMLSEAEKETEVKASPEKKKELEVINKENEELKKRIDKLKEDLDADNKTLANTQSTLNTQLERLTKDIDKEKKKVEE